MDQRAKEQFSKALLDLASTTTSQPDAGAQYVGANIGHGFFAIVGEKGEVFQKLLERLVKTERFEETVSEGTATQLLLHAIGEIQASPSEAAAVASLESLLGKFAAIPRQLAIYVPIDGILVEKGEVVLGNVSLFEMTPARLADMLGQSKTVFASPSQDVVGRVSARYECNAEQVRGIERAKEEVERVLDILRYSIPFFTDLGYEKETLAFGIRGTVPSYLFTTIFVRDQAKPGADFNMNITGPVPLTLGKATLARLVEIGAMRVADALKKPSRELTDIERLVLRGVHWFANSQFQAERENELLSLITCLETFLTPRDGNPIGTAIAEGVALLTETSLQERKRVKKRVQELYRLRSAVSHGGEKAVADAELKELREITKRLVTCMVGQMDKISSQKDLLQHIEDLKLS